MNNFENLNERVENAVQKFHQSEDLRRRENKSLSRILNDLEIKFEARSAELDDCQLRIDELEESNVSLNALVCQLVDMVEKSAEEVSKDPLYRASAAASEIVERYVAEAPANQDIAPAMVQGPAPAPQKAPPLVSAPAAPLEAGFEDIGEEFLLAEDLFEKTEGAAEFPKLVFDAMAMARGEEIPVAAVRPAEQATEIDGAETENAPSGDGDLDIKEIMARLEIAAERAELRADEGPGRDRREADAEVPGRAVGGRA